ncbi:thioredoxin fold domain-containing protein [Acidithiobacillus thiooxidans]|uniref:Thiol:disulfide interchange protein DsbG n=1 Tax=Acidithiobacillus thiooxidans ATCC 19377 TaxID=637390 RepID=A0A543Q1X3_ACITH|nr:thioredoxin fold domain-containing protein [Acidithiobacillus thiooxidans]MDX5935559.1 thioredoxin fold domain-containing protein [Acidithiobacillus thiooxidans]TQN50298.1 Thiol:disulfide interchange protein DsbG [Acidithiobacillus thiooxidans ATCC 19377]
MSHKEIRKAFLGALSTALVIGGVVAVSAQAAVPDYGPLIQKLSHQRLHLVKTLPTGIHGLTALLAETSTGQKNLAFGLDGKYLIPGPVIAANGKMLNTEMAEKLGLVPKPLPVAQVLNQAVAAPGFVLGHGGPMVAAFMDPNCIFCHKFYEAVLPELKAGKLRIKVVPVAFLKPSSLPKAVAILSAKDPAKAWAFDEAHFNVHTEEGGITPAKNLKVPATARIEANTHLLARTGEIATPTVMVCRKDGKPVLWHGVAPDHLKRIQDGAIGDLLPTGSCRG